METGWGLAGVPFDLAYSSPLARALETARLVLDAQNDERVRKGIVVQDGTGALNGAGLRNGTAAQAGAGVSNGAVMRNGTAAQAGVLNGAGMRNGTVVQKGARPAAVPIVEDERLLEISFGVMEGKKVRDDNGILVVENFIRFFNDPERYLPPEEGESFQSLLKRTGAFLEELKQKERARKGEDGQGKGGPGKSGSSNILISTHGAASRALLANISRCPLRDFWCGGVPKNCAVTIVDLENGDWKIKEQDVLFVRAI